MPFTYNAETKEFVTRGIGTPWFVNLGLAASLTASFGAIGFLAGTVALPATVLPLILLVGGTSIGLVLSGALVPKMTIRNNVTQAFVTIDKLRSLLGHKETFVLYEPGEHVSYLWEQRIEAQTLILKESSQEFEFMVQCKDGILTGTGSFRLRPDMMQAITFLRGVGAVGEDLVDIVVVKAIEVLAESKVINASTKLKELNKALEYFKHGESVKISKSENLSSKNDEREVEDDASKLSKFENRFGVEVGDVTVSKLLPSKEVQRTLAGLTEAVAIKQGTAIMLGMSMQAVAQGLQNGTLDKALYERTRKDFMSISGNLEGITVERKEFSLEGLTPEIAAAVLAMAEQFAAMRSNSNKKGNRK